MDGRIWYSLEFGESDVTVDPNAPFSPVTALGRHGYRLDLNSYYTDSPGMCCGSSRRGGHGTAGTGLPRSISSSDDINVHHVFGNLSSARVGEDEVIGAEILSDMIHRSHNAEPVISDEEDEDEYDDEEAEHEEGAEVIDVEAGVTLKKIKKKAGGTRGPKGKTLEDECLIDTWKAHVSLCPITGANQNGGTYCKRIYDQLNERENFGDYAAIQAYFSF